MMRKNVSLTELLNAAVLVACFAGTIGFAIGYGKWFDKWVYLPVFPNALDSAFLAFSATYLAGRIALAEKLTRRK